MPGNISLVNNVAMTNSTHDMCLFKAYGQLKGLSFFDEFREEKIEEIQKNLECALEKYKNIKLKKKPTEDSLDFIGRLTEILSFLHKLTGINDTKDAKSEVMQTRVLGS